MEPSSQECESSPAYSPGGLSSYPLPCGRLLYSAGNPTQAFPLNGSGLTITSLGSGEMAAANWASQTMSGFLGPVFRRPK